MTILIEDSEEITCSQCDQLRKTFMLIAISAVFPMVIFCSLLLIIMGVNMNRHIEITTSLIVEFVFGLLYVQLFVAASVLIISFMKRRHPPLKYQYWYLFFHTGIMTLFLGSCFALAAVNETYTTSAVVIIFAAMYFFVIYEFVSRRRHASTTLGRAY